MSDLKWYNIANASKYGINEIQYFKNSEGMVFKIDTNWKSGSLDVSTDKSMRILQTLSNTLDVYPSFDEAYINSFTDGCDEYTFIDSNGEEIEQTEKHAAFIESFQDEGVNFLYDSGFTDDEDDPDVIITGGFTFEDTTDPTLGFFTDTK
tara:strand:- start:7107 stop:7556 length:450 start_codon:yes stop_codon:yes gene_type:complete